MENSNTGELLLLPKGIALNKSERQEMCRIIEAAVKQIYNVKTFYHGIIEVDGVPVEYEYMSKAVNNILLLRRLVYDRTGELSTGIQTKEDLFRFVKANTTELFHPRGRHFRFVYALLESATKRGDAGEEQAFRFVEEMARKKGLQVRVLKTRGVGEDVFGGVDGFFTYNDRNFTIQVKPLSDNYAEPIQEYGKDPTMYVVYCSGFVGSIKTDYLVLYDRRRSVCYLFQNKGLQARPGGLLIPKSSEVLV